MIKLNKDYRDIPESLIPAYIDLFVGKSSVPMLSKNTHGKRMEIINFGAYIDKDEFNSRYKKQDIRTELNSIYKNKCAFCEQKVEQYHIEHYRPKNIYYWLAYSWDNLLMACPDCNQSKGTKFELDGQKVTVDTAILEIRYINNLSSSYDTIEQPRLVNPEITNPLTKIQFEKNGIIKSNDIRFSYTITTCSIDRIYLNDERRKLLDIFKRDIRSVLVVNTDINEQRKEIGAIIRKFIRDSEDDELPFLAFRRFSISAGWLNEIVKELN